MNERVRYNTEIVDREDLAFNMELIPMIKRIVCSEYVGYYYLQRETSLLHTKSLKRLEKMKAFCDFMYEIEIKDSEVKEKIYNHCVKQYISDCVVKNILWNTALSKQEKKEMMNEIFSNKKLRNTLSDNKQEPRYLKAIFKSFEAGNYKSFYRFFILSEIKRKVGM